MGFAIVRQIPSTISRTIGGIWRTTAKATDVADTIPHNSSEPKKKNQKKKI